MHGPHPGLGCHGGREQATEARLRLSGKPVTPIEARLELKSSVTLLKPKSLPVPLQLRRVLISVVICCSYLLLSSLRYVFCLAVVLNS